MKWIIEADAPFKGHALSVLKDDGTVAYTNGLTVEGYAKQRGTALRVIDDAEFDALLANHYASLKTAPQPITAERFDEMLGILPPCRWHKVGGFTVFHVSEHLTGPLVSWFAKTSDGQYWEFTQADDISDADLLEMLTEAARPIPQLSLTYRSSDNGHCCVYYTGQNGGLYCYQLVHAGKFQLLTCSRDGEPEAPVQPDWPVWAALPQGDERIDLDLRDWLQGARQAERALRAVDYHNGAPRRNAHGNIVERWFSDRLTRYTFDGLCDRSTGWAQYDTEQDASYFGVWVHIEERRILTYAEGDITLVSCRDDAHLKAELDDMARLYGAPPPAVVGIDADGSVTEFYDKRPSV